MLFHPVEAMIFDSTLTCALISFFKYLILFYSQNSCLGTSVSAVMVAK